MENNLKKSTLTKIITFAVTMRNLKLPAFICMIMLSVSTLAQASSVGSELHRTIERRSMDPNDFLNVLERFSSFMPVMNMQERYIFIETSSLVYSCELNDKNLALSKIKWFKQKFLNNRNKKEMEMFCNILTGKIHLCYGQNIDLAVKSFEKALSDVCAGSKIEDKNEETVQLYCEALTKKGNHYKALNYLLRLLNDVYQNKKENRKAEIIRHIALTFSKLNKPDSCLNYLNKSIEIALNNKDDENISRTALELGIFWLNKGKFSDALTYLNEAFKRIHHLENHSQRLILCKSIGKLYLSKENSEKALFFRELEFNYADSIKIAEKIKSDAVHHYELTKKRERQLEIQEAYHQVSTQMKWGIIIGLLTVIFVIWTSFRLKKNSSKHSNTSRGLSEIMTKLNGTELASNPEKEKMIEELIIDLRAKSSLQKWDDFEKSFDTEFPDFLTKLKEAHPKLSLNERKLCMCLSRNLTTKEILPLTGQNAHAVNIARGRLRKKLGIDHREISIPEYLDQFLQR